MRSAAIMIILTLWVLFIVFKSVVLLDFPGADRDNYGPFQAAWHHYELCRGPKSKNATLFHSALKKIGETYGADFNLTFYSNVKFDEIKISVFAIKDGNKQSLWSYKLENPCKHIGLGVVLETRLHAKNCLVKKGIYYSYVNFTSLSYDFFGTSFFYGEFLFKVTMLSKSGNIGCLTFCTEFSKKE